MRNFYQEFILLDMSNTTRHLRQKFPYVRHYGDADYDRLEWLEVTMPMYLEDVKKVAAIQASSSRRRRMRNFLSPPTLVFPA
ncbi:hypothetical protein HPB48_011576 [Haemaphysalis longicornis]|uniref:Uncharacterized protein n=1 Tax=Haemaphysalis longicornis TaxID=44386 RepID=A0A9J6FZU5_HAELO|nr:hypothetical protein HPB48_011576 [Haemaphysalis longicornis]